MYLIPKCYTIQDMEYFKKYLDKLHKTMRDEEKKIYDRINEEKDKDYAKGILIFIIYLYYSFFDYTI